MKKTYLLFGSVGGGSAITEAFLRHAKIKYAHTKLEWESRDEWPTTLGKYNPLLQVPALILPSGEVMTETLATAVHANRKKKGLIPGKKLEDRFWRWAVFIVANIYPTFTVRDNAEKFVTTKTAQDELSESMMERRKFLWLTLEKECGKKWFLGEKFSAIDIYLGVMVHWTPGKEWFESHAPKIYSIAKRLRKKAPYAKLLQEHFGES